MATDPTRQELEDALTEYRNAEKAAAAGLTYSVDGLSLTRHNLSMIKNKIAEIRRQLIDLDQYDANPKAKLGQRAPTWN